MKRRLVSLIDRIRADLNDAAGAIERDDIDGALAKLAAIAEQLATHAKEMIR